MAQKFPSGKCRHRLNAVCLRAVPREVELRGAQLPVDHDVAELSRWLATLFGDIAYPVGHGERSSTLLVMLRWVTVRLAWATADSEVARRSQRLCGRSGGLLSPGVSKEPEERCRLNPRRG